MDLSMEGPWHPWGFPCLKRLVELWQMPMEMSMDISYKTWAFNFLDSGKSRAFA